MFDEEFYPTPVEVIKKMIEPYIEKKEHIDRWGNKEELIFFKNRETIILEPSAGKGDILDYIKEFGLDNEMYCMERNIDLQAILRGKNFNIIGTDFLQEEIPYYFNLIIMNPPFSNADEHLLRAWQILPDGDIACLVNSETILNPCSKKRELLGEIIARNGFVEHLGPCFDSAERKTNVEIALVRLHKPQKSGGGFNFNFESVKKEEGESVLEESPERLLAIPDALKALTDQYMKVLELTKEYLTLTSKIEFFSTGISTVSAKDILKDCRGEGIEKYNHFVKRFTMHSWESLFDRFGFEKYMTGKVKKDFRKVCEERGALLFNKESILNLLQDLIGNRENIFRESLLDVTKKLTSFDIKNKEHIEGWKTNDAYKINKKVIIPYCINHDEWGFRRTYGGWNDFLSDLDKVLCRLSNKSLEKIVSITHALDKKLSVDKKGLAGNECDSTFFYIRFFKKGTLHLTFLDQDLYEDLNIKMAEYRGWELPEIFNKREYKR